MRSKFATLRAKIIGSIIAATAVILLLLYLPLRQILIKSYSGLEKQTVSSNVQRVLNQITNTIQELTMTAADYASWDDTYTHMETFDQAYIDSNYIDTTYINNRLNVIMLVDTSGGIVYADAYDFNEETPTSIPEQLLTLDPDDRLLTPIYSGESVEGLLIAGNRPMFVASQPILTSNSEGPPHGALIMARFLDGSMVARLGATVQLSLKVTHIADPALDPQTQAARDTMLTTDVTLLVKSEEQQTIAGYAIVNDIYDNPAIILRIDSDREIYAQGRITLTYLGSAMLFVGIAFNVTMWWLLGRLVLTRMNNFRANVTQIGVLGSIGDFSSRVPVEGGDELSQLGTTINVMLGNLEKYQKELLIQKQR
ncbi:MAG: HAMP domain-containing protein, partial [Anaerolineae bacterium]|nr:HAMP domain-containing protein [Anaerolineae bacterium]